MDHGLTNKISIIINNYNYAQFLEECILSVLTQKSQIHELIVVDDGSTDESRTIIDKYNSRLKILLKENGGQASAFNAGYNAASGDWIWFVDADDVLLPGAYDAAQKLVSPEVSKIQSRLQLIDEKGNLSGSLFPPYELSQGDVLQEMQTTGNYRWPPTTGNIFSRHLLEQCMPIPEMDYRLCADFYLCSYAGFAGTVVNSKSELGCYRVHSNNGFYGVRMEDKRLYSNGQILLTVRSRMNDLFRQFGDSKPVSYPFSRSNLESLAIARRFGRLRLPQDLRGLSMHKKWLQTKEIQQSSLTKKFTAGIFWMVLNYAPLSIAKKAIQIGFKKLRKSRNNL